MSADATPPSLLRREHIAALAETRFHHPLNDNAVRLTRSLGDATGLRKLGLHLVRLTPGRDSTEYHVHHYSEEFVYILEGRGVLEHAGVSQEVAAGDFAAFTPANGAHALHNPFDAELVYLAGGQRLDFDVCDYPRAGRRLFGWRGREHYADLPDRDGT